MAGVIFNKLSGENDSMYGKILTPLRQVIIDNIKEDAEDNVLLKAMFNVEMSDNWAESSTGQTGLSTMKPVIEGGKVDNDSVVETYKKSVEHTTFKNRISITAEMLEDAKAGAAVRKAAPLVAGLGASYIRTRCEFGTKALTDGETTTSFTFNGMTFDKTTGDGSGIFSTSHKCKKTGVTNLSNVFTNELGTDSAMLNRLANIGRNQINESGVITRYLFDTIMIPGNTPAMEDTIKKIMGSERVVGSAYNDINTQKGLWKLVVNPYWIVDSGKYPYIIMSSKALKETSGSTFYDRTKLQIKETVDDEWNLILSARARFSAVFYDWRHLIMGGAASGTTLS